MLFSIFKYLFRSREIQILKIQISQMMTLYTKQI